MAPPVVIRPILPAVPSTNQRFPSGPAAMPSGRPLGTGNSLTAPAGVIRPIWLARNSVNQRFPSAPAATKLTSASDGRLNSVTPPVGPIRPIWFAVSSVNQRLPSGPAAMPSGEPAAPAGSGNSVTVGIAADDTARLTDRRSDTVRSTMGRSYLVIFHSQL